MTLPDIIVTKGNITNEELWRYASATRGARFLFDKETQDYCDKLREEAVAVQVLRQIIDQPSSIFEFDFLMDEPHRSNEEAWSNRKQWFIAQVDEIPKQFAPFLQLIG